jgi:hypothetical protein
MRHLLATLLQDDMHEAVSKDEVRKAAPPRDADAAALLRSCRQLLKLAICEGLAQTMLALSRLLLGQHEAARREYMERFRKQLAAGGLEALAQGELQPFASELLAQVPAGALAAAATGSSGRSSGFARPIAWGGAPLATHKLVCIVQQLRDSAPEGSRDVAAMVFVETRASALALAALLNTIMAGEAGQGGASNAQPGALLRAAPFIGTAEMDLKASGLGLGERIGWALQRLSPAA